MVRQEAKAQGPSSTPNSEEVSVMWEPQKKEERWLLCWAISPTLSSSQPHSSATLPMLEYRSSLTPKAPRNKTWKQKQGAQLSSALALRLPLAPTAFIQGSIKFFWQTSIHQSPREINALTSLMPCSAQFCSAEPPSSVLCYLRRAWGHRESNSTILHRGLNKVPVHITASAMVDTLQEEGAVIRLTVSNMSIFMCLCVQAQPSWGKEAAVWLCCIVSIKCDRGRVF